jgi:hypothetical protein
MTIPSKPIAGNREPSLAKTIEETAKPVGPRTDRGRATDAPADSRKDVRPASSDPKGNAKR